MTLQWTEHEQDILQSIYFDLIHKQQNWPSPMVFRHVTIRMHFTFRDDTNVTLKTSKQYEDRIFSILHLNVIENEALKERLEQELLEEDNYNSYDDEYNDVIDYEYS